MLVMLPKQWLMSKSFPCKMQLQTEESARSLSSAARLYTSTANPSYPSHNAFYIRLGL